MGDFTEMNFITIHEVSQRILDGHIRFKGKQRSNIIRKKMWGIIKSSQQLIYTAHKLILEENYLIKKTTA